MLIRLPRAPAAKLLALLDTAWQPVSWVLGRATPSPPPTCVACGNPVHDQDPHIRYRGEYYHAEPCLETEPAALRRHQLLMDQVTP